MKTIFRLLCRKRMTVRCPSVPSLQSQEQKPGPFDWVFTALLFKQCAWFWPKEAVVHSLQSKAQQAFSTHQWWLDGSEIRLYRAPRLSGRSGILAVKSIKMNRTGGWTWGCMEIKYDLKDVFWSNLSHAMEIKLPQRILTVNTHLHFYLWSLGTEIILVKQGN